MTFENNTIDDFVLLKSDGDPTYHLANIVDDHLMEISHVLRAEEWLSSVPRHVLIYQALGYEPPQFAHQPMILGADRGKLSKRHGAVPIVEYYEQGYCRCGWGEGHYLSSRLNGGGRAGGRKDYFT